jgi:hypothetical protein
MYRATNSVQDQITRRSQKITSSVVSYAYAPMGAEDVRDTNILVRTSLTGRPEKPFESNDLQQSGVPLSL